jgi:hypothetical protein
VQGVCTLAAVVKSSRRLLIGLGAAFVLAFAVANVLSGRASAGEMLLYAAPFVAIVGLLLSGRYVGEARILAGYRTPPRPRRANGVVRRRPGHELPFSGALERAPWSLRGPPALIAS